MEINPTKLIKGQGLAKLLIESNYEALEIIFLINNVDCSRPEGAKNEI